MFWNKVYRTLSSTDRNQQVIRIHGIGDVHNFLMEMRLGVMRFDDEKTLAICDSEHSREIAELFSKKLGLPIET